MVAISCSQENTQVTQPLGVDSVTADHLSRDLEESAMKLEPQYSGGTEQTASLHGDLGTVSCSQEGTMLLEPNRVECVTADDSSSSTERPYSRDDLDGKTKDDLIAIIRGQIYRWPESTFNPSKIKKDILKARILENGFTGVFAPLPLQSPRDDSDLPETHRPLKYRSLELFIQDMRVQPPNQFMQSIVVPSAGDLDTGEWLVNGNELIRAIQNSPSSLDGAQELAFNDLMQPGWKRDFVKILGSEILEEESTSSPQFTVPADSRLEIVVEDSVPPTTSSGSEATTASPAASPSGTDLHTDMSNSPEAGRRRSTRKRPQTAYIDALDRGDGTVDGWGRKAYPTGLQVPPRF
ncbi:hypothetical protein B0H14DRAFT_2877809 [Mycena olivaceomarginata]|nr:hypothetical protein B0H14DRAFT_2877809 [Mycena olivaceomarginata]